MIGCHKTEPSVRFTNQVCIKPLYEYNYQTGNPLVVQVDGAHITVPENFTTDLASIPKIIWPVVSPAHSQLIEPAILHDYLYRKPTEYTRYQSDLIFYYAMLDKGIRPFKASIVYYAVRVFGFPFYKG